MNDSDSAGAYSAGAGTTIREMNNENSKIPDMFESISSSLSGILFFMNERLWLSATRTKQRYCRHHSLDNSFSDYAGNLQVDGLVFQIGQDVGIVAARF